MKSYKLFILGLLFLTQPHVNASEAFYLTAKEKTKQGWPINFDVPRELPEKLEKGIKEKINKNIQHQVNMIMEWSESQTKEELLSKLDTSKILNPSNDDDTIENRAKKIAKQKILEKLNIQPTSSNAPETTSHTSYWRKYAPQMLQDAGDYAASWIPQSVKDRINSWSTRKKLAVAGAILASLAAIYNRDILIAFVNDAIEKQRQAKFESDVEFGITGIKQHLALTEQREVIHGKDSSMSVEDHLQAYYNHLMKKNPEDGERIYNEVVSRLAKEGFFEE